MTRIQLRPEAKPRPNHSPPNVTANRVADVT